MLLCRYVKECVEWSLLKLGKKPKKLLMIPFFFLSVEKEQWKRKRNKNSVVLAFLFLFPVIYRWKTKLINRNMAWGLIFRYHNKVYEIRTKYCLSCFGVHIAVTIPDSMSEMFNTSGVWVLLQEKKFKGTGNENNHCSRWCGHHKLTVWKYWKLMKGKQNDSFI